jgi:hypothetical protein
MRISLPCYSIRNKEDRWVKWSAKLHLAKLGSSNQLGRQAELKSNFGRISLKNGRIHTIMAAS